LRLQFFDELVIRDGLRQIYPLSSATMYSIGSSAAPPTRSATRIGWSGRNGASSSPSFVTRYDNPHPEKTVAAVDFFATNNAPRRCAWR